MMTVKEISKITGISARTIHYYDEIGLFTPTGKTEAGYRLYDDRALESLQQILFFREFDISLKEIKSIMENPNLDRNQILQMQKEMLLAKKERIEKLVASIDDILKGVNKMDFEVFNKKEIEDMYNAMEKNMTEEQKKLFIDRYGSIEAWKEGFLKKASTEEVQQNFAQVVEWYGSKEKALEASMNPQNTDLQLDYQNRVTEIIQDLAANMDKDIHEASVQKLIGEYDALTKEMFQLPEASTMVLELAKAYQENKELQDAQDSIYGAGATEYIGRAMEAFYEK